MTDMFCKKEKKPVVSTGRSDLNDDLVIASRYGDLRKVVQLLEVGASVEYWPEGASLVRHSLRGVDHVSDMEEELIFQSLALYAACHHGHFQVVLTLFQHLRDHPQSTIDYWLVLFQTLRNRRGFQLGAELIHVNPAYCVHHALFAGSASLPILNELVRAGADLNARCQCGMTPLVSAVSNAQCSTEVVLTLLKAGADPNVTFGDNISPLSMAAKYGNVKAMEALLRYGADATLLSDKSYSDQAQHPLVYSVIHGHVTQVRLLLLQGMRPISMLQYVVHARHSFPFHIDDVAAFFSKRISLLYLALYCNRVEVARFLLDIHFLSWTDIASLPNDKSLRRKLLLEDGFQETNDLLEKIQSKPWSLFTLCFHSVSESVGFTAQRGSKLRQLGLPDPLIRKLLFLK